MAFYFDKGGYIRDSETDEIVAAVKSVDVSHFSSIWEHSTEVRMDMVLLNEHLWNTSRYDRSHHATPAAIDSAPSLALEFLPQPKGIGHEPQA